MSKWYFDSIFVSNTILCQFLRIIRFFETNKFFESSICQKVILYRKMNIFFKYFWLWVFSRSSDYYCRLNLKTSFLLSKGKTDRLLTATILIWSLCSAQIYLILTTKSILVWKSFLAELAQTDSWKGALSSMILHKKLKTLISKFEFFGCFQSVIFEFRAKSVLIWSSCRQNDENCKPIFSRLNVKKRSQKTSWCRRLRKIDWIKPL